MASKTVRLEKVDTTGARDPWIHMPGPPLKAFWEGELRGRNLAFTCGLVGKGAKKRIERSFDSEQLAEQEFDRAVAAQLRIGFVQVGKPGKHSGLSARKATAAPLTYHQRLADSLDMKPAVSAKSLESLALREERCGARFPVSVKEWFSLRGVHALFRANTNADELVPLARLGDPDELRQGYLRVATENQGVVSWFARLDGSEDPPVFQTDAEGADLEDAEWVACADSFSEFLRELLLK